MRVFLRHIRTRYYYLGNLEWTMEAADARDFRSLEQALEVVQREKLDGMSIVVRYDESGREQEFDLSRELPVQPPAPKAKEG